MVSRSLRPIAGALLALALLVPSVARAADEGDFGIPSNGEDVVRLDDGRTLRCRVAPAEGGNLRLEFADGSVTVPASRVARTLRFRDFDPAPRDAAEKEKAARGLVRWAGEWLTPVRVQELRERHLSEERQALSIFRPPAGMHTHRAGKFEIHSALPLVRTREYGALLDRFVQCLRSEIQIPIDEALADGSIRVYIHADRESFLRHAKEDGGVGEHTVGYYAPGRTLAEGHIVVFDMPEDPDETLDVLLHEATHLFLDMASSGDMRNVRPWLNEGLAEYMGASTWKYGRFQPGALQEERLLWFQERIEAGGVVPLATLVQQFPPTARGGAFGLDHYAESWCFVHFLFHGRNGYYRGAIRDYLKQRHFTGGSVEPLLTRLERKDWTVIEKQFLEYARGLKLTGGRAYAERALRRLSEDDEAGAEADLEKAVARAGRDLPSLVRSARAARYLGKGAMAADLYRRALEEDPLDARVRLERSFILEDEEGEREARLALALAPQDEALRKGSKRRAGFTAEKAAEAEIGKGIDAILGGSLQSQAALGATLKAGHVGVLRGLIESAPGAPNPRTVGLGALLDGVEKGPAAMAQALEAFRKSERARGEAGKGGGYPLSPAASFSGAIAMAFGVGHHAGKGPLVADAFDLLYEHEDPETESEWLSWASAHTTKPGRGRALSIVENGLRVFHRSYELKQLRRALESE